MIITIWINSYNSLVNLDNHATTRNRNSLSKTFNFEKKEWNLWEVINWKQFVNEQLIKVNNHKYNNTNYRESYIVMFV